MQKENKKALLFSYRGLEIYKEYEDDEDGFVSFLGMHSMATKGDNATVSMEDIETLIFFLKWTDEMIVVKSAMEYVLKCICTFMEKKDNVEAQFCDREVYFALTEEEKEDWYGVGNDANPEFYIKIRDKELWEVG